MAPLPGARFSPAFLEAVANNVCSPAGRPRPNRPCLARACAQNSYRGHAEFPICRDSVNTERQIGVLVSAALVLRCLFLDLHSCAGRTSSRCMVKGVAAPVPCAAPSIDSIALVSGNSSSGPVPSGRSADASAVVSG